ncbi:MAG TPA: alternate-type signal peptide domain-containing protein [Microbacteriaceae bacterium]|nr:alternate-type signal peptide domain-containing protein [Microbacteriaceae bacterium]
MNRNAKGAIAVGAATLLLLGGGGTFALWNASQEVAAGTVISGELSLVQGVEDGWYDFASYAADYDADYATWLADPRSDDLDPGHATWLTEEPDVADYLTPGDKIADIANYMVVPETDLVYVVNDFAITAVGSNLHYTFESDVDLAAAATLGYTVTVRPLGAADLPGTGAPAGASEYVGVATGTTVYTVNSTAPETTTFDAGLRVKFDADDQLLFGSELDLTDFSFVLQQVVKS